MKIKSILGFHTKAANVDTNSSLKSKPEEKENERGCVKNTQESL